ncbi:hypothetical protein ARZXY2_517 [Arthrobacter sp. ZXY-2]|nr:hypothetical protein ARZXY2_517 [Arthrobacter sp. ZXY-2]
MVIANRTSRTRQKSRDRRRRNLFLLLWMGVFTVLLIACTAWLGFKANIIREELQSATALLPQVKAQIAKSDTVAAAASVKSLAEHTQRARDSANDPLWKIASSLPWIGPNLQAASEVATSADDVARLGAVPLVAAYQSLDWKTLAPTSNGLDLAPLKAAAPRVQSAAYAVRESAKRLHRIEINGLMPQIADPLVKAREELSELSHGLDAAADVSRLAPPMLGADAPQRYLLLMQNNAESRATGGIPGAVAILTVDHGSLTLSSQTSAGALGVFDPPISIADEERAIYTARVGKFMQDVNLTPDFATTASVAHNMWETKTGDRLDGVLSIDPVALSFILEATGPVAIGDPATRSIGGSLPAKLTQENVVRTLLSDVYSTIEDPELQDAYFAGAAKEIFTAVSRGNADPKLLMGAITKGVNERRVLLWSAVHETQSTIGKYTLGGLTSGPNVSPAQFGVYFNDGTGAKMDFWVKRTVQVVRDCGRNGYREVTVRVTSTNTAPSNAATALPSYVTGGKAFGIPEGTVQTNVIVYGPTQSAIDTVTKDEKQIPFTAQRHNQRGVGSSTIRLAPGESTTLDFNIGHIVQNAEPDVVVTPTTQAVKDVLLTPKLAPCE